MSEYDSWFKDYMEQRIELTTLCGLGYTKDKEGNLVKLLDEKLHVDIQPVKEETKKVLKKSKLNKIFSFFFTLYKYKKRN